MLDSQKVIEILNSSERSRKLNGIFEERIAQCQLTEEEKSRLREFKMMFITLDNKEALQVIAESLYNELAKS